MMEKATTAIPQGTFGFTPWSGMHLQRKCDCGQHTIAGGECESCEKEKASGNLQRAATNAGSINDVPPIVHEVLRSPGQPLDAAPRAFFEPRFGHDFSHVRVHTGAHAAESARAVNALAYTLGQNIVFASARYQPGTEEGMKLLAHELAHTVQQRQAANVSPSEEIPLGAPDSLQEREAASAAQDLGLATARAAIAPHVQRKTWDDLPIYEERPEIIGQRETERAKPATEKPKKTPASCTRTIFAEGTCADLVAGSKFICCDPTNGIERKGRKTDIEGTSCPSEKFTPIFTCDSKCKKALARGCSDNDNWMAVPNNQFTTSQCGDIWTICANGKQTTGYVRDHSVTETRFEVSPKIQKDLGVTVGSSFKGAIYKPGANKAVIDKDSCCNS